MNHLLRFPSSTLKPHCVWMLNLTTGLLLWLEGASKRPSGAQRTPLDPPFVGRVCSSRRATIGRSRNHMRRAGHVSLISNPTEPSCNLTTATKPKPLPTENHLAEVPVTTRRLGSFDFRDAQFTAFFWQKQCLTSKTTTGPISRLLRPLE